MLIKKYLRRAAAFVLASLTVNTIIVLEQTGATELLLYPS